MASPEVQKPGSIHQKEISSISVRTIMREEGEDNGKEPAGRKKEVPRPLKINLRKSKGVIELLPKPSDNDRDPLVWASFLKELSTMLTRCRIGQPGRKSSRSFPLCFPSPLLAY